MGSRVLPTLILVLAVLLLVSTTFFVVREQDMAQVVDFDSRVEVRLDGDVRQRLPHPGAGLLAAEVATGQIGR